MIPLLIRSKMVLINIEILLMIIRIIFIDQKFYILKEKKILDLIISYH